MIQKTAGDDASGMAELYRHIHESTIRKAVEGDIPGVAALYQHVHEAEQRGESHTGWLPDVYPVEKTAREALSRDDLYVCEEDGTITAVGIINQLQVDVYAQGHWQYPAADDQVLVLHTLAVEPSLARRGLGRAFAAFYEALARSMGCTVLRLDTNVINTPARRLYASLGFQEAGIVPCNFNSIPNVQLVLLEKPLGTQSNHNSKSSTIKQV